MSDNFKRDQAMILFERAYRHQMRQELGDAIQLYKRSIILYPTAEAYTFLGWTYSMMDRYEEAIAECKKAIEIDPAYGNPYNDIGAYLIELNRWDEAIPWLQKAIMASRYEAPQYPYINLGRVYERLGRYSTALSYYNRAIDIDPFNRAAIWAKYQLLGRLN